MSRFVPVLLVVCPALLAPLTATAACRPGAVVRDLTTDAAGAGGPSGAVTALPADSIRAADPPGARTPGDQAEVRAPRSPDPFADLDRGLRRIVQVSDRAVGSGPAAAREARCAVELLAGWAAGEGMLGRLGDRAAAFRVTWRSAGVAMAWAKARRAATPEEAAAVCGWLRRLVPIARSTVSPTNRDGQLYLAGLVALAVGVGCGDDVLVAEGRDAFDQALAAIDGRGALPTLLRARDSGWRRHAFAMSALAPMAELAARELRQDWWSARDGALHRLAGLTIAGARDPAAFAAAVGTPASGPVAPGPGTADTAGDTEAASDAAATERRGAPPAMAWLALYGRRFPDRATNLPDYRSYSTWTGGDLAGLAGAWIAP